MKAIITGMNGTVAPVLNNFLRRQGIQMVVWDRRFVPIDDAHAVHTFLEQHCPNWFFHVATGPAQWAEKIAGECYRRHIKLLFTGSVSIFDPQKTNAPITIHQKPTATDEYGIYKIDCERKILTANPDAIIARLGWQIGNTPGSNNMVDFLHNEFSKKGEIEAGDQYFPSCSFLEDTAAGLFNIIMNFDKGIFHLEGNPGISFYEIVTALNTLNNNNWQISKIDTPVIDNRMTDAHIQIQSIKRTLYPGN